MPTIMTYRPYSRLLLLVFLIYAVSFLVIFPLFLWNRPFSVYYNLRDKEAIAKIKQRNQERTVDAERGFEVYKERSYNFNYRRLQSRNLYLLITVVTTSRVTSANDELRYLIQSVVSSHRELVENEDIHAALVICNVDREPMKHKQALSLSQHFPTIVKNRSTTTKDIYDKEKDDYVYCLEQARLFNPQYVLMVEDDAVPYPSMLPYLRYILDNKIATMFQRGERVNRTDPWLALKLYYPETWLGFGLEMFPILQLAGLCCVFASLFVAVAWGVSAFFHTRHTVGLLYLVMLTGAVYGLMIAYGIGRQNLFELCRIHPMFFHIYHAPGCCTPATLFPVHRISRFTDHLSRVVCNSKFGLDLAMDEYARTERLTIYQAAPNLFRHVGMFSTLTSNKNRYGEFLM